MYCFVKCEQADRGAREEFANKMQYSKYWTSAVPYLFQVLLDWFYPSGYSLIIHSDRRRSFSVKCPEHGPTKLWVAHHAGWHHISVQQYCLVFAVVVGGNIQDAFEGYAATVGHWMADHASYVGFNSYGVCSQCISNR